MGCWSSVFITASGCSTSSDFVYENTGSNSGIPWGFPSHRPMGISTSIYANELEPSVVGKSLVSFGHTMNFVAFLDRRTFIFEGRHELGGKLLVDLAA